MKKILIMAAALAVASCAEDGGLSDGVLFETEEASTEVSFYTSILPETRVTSDQFDTNDDIFVTAMDGSDTFASKVSYSYNGTMFTSETPIEYNSVEVGETAQELSFLAVYPAISTFGESFSFTAEADQSSGDNYEMSDLLVAQTDATSSTTPTLSFVHQMSSLVVNVSSNTVSLTDGVLKVSAQNTADVDLTAGTSVATGSKVEMTPLADGTNSYKIIIAPQTIEAGDAVATFTVGGDTYVWYASSSIVFQSGYRRTYSWSIDSGDIALDGNIEGWVDDEITDDESNSDNNDDDTTGNDDGTYSVWDGSIATAFSSGDGSSTTPYVIGSASELAYFASMGNSATLENNYFSLSTNIDLNGLEWDAIGSDAIYFWGQFDGKGYTVKGLSITGSNSFQALFAAVGNNGRVSNLTVSGSVSGNEHVGAIVGFNFGVIDGCVGDATVSGSLFAGGVVGYNQSTGNIINCSHSGTVSAGNHFGGIAGYSWGVVTNCYNEGTVENTTGYYAGGIVGYCQSTCVVTNCYNSGTVNNFAIAGGMVGANEGGSIVNGSTLSGSVTSEQGSYGESGTVRSSSEMADSRFTATLNNNAATFNATSPTVSACAWVDGTTYPAFDLDAAPQANSDGYTEDSDDVIVGYTDYSSVLSGSDYYVIALDDTSYASISSNVVSDLRNDGGNTTMNVWGGYSDGTQSDNNSLGVASSWYSYIVTAPDYWSGLGLCSGNSGDYVALSSLSTVTDSPNDYYLHLAMKSSFGVTHVIRLEASGATTVNFAVSSGGSCTVDGVEYDSDSAVATYTADGEWYHIDIPVNKLTSAGFFFNSAASAAANVFCMLSGATVDATLDFDAVFFYKK